MSQVQTNFRAVDMLGAAQPVVVAVEAPKKVAPKKAVAPKVEEPVVVEEVVAVVEEAPAAEVTEPEAE